MRRAPSDKISVILSLAAQAKRPCVARCSSGNFRNLLYPGDSFQNSFPSAHKVRPSGLAGSLPGRLGVLGVAELCLGQPEPPLPVVAQVALESGSPGPPNQ